ncbi:MAG: BrnT family toxin [Armatimonadota bacterium]
MTLRIDEFHWINWIVDKLADKHGVDTEEVEDALLNDDPAPFVWKKGDRYLALAQDEDGGEYLFIVFDMESGNIARVITARPMDRREKSRFKKLRNIG